jgi:hypothetical protein
VITFLNPNNEDFSMARFDRGWIKLHRKVLDSDLMDNPNLLRLWIWLLLSATRRETTIIWNGQKRIIPPGCVVYGVSELARKWKTSKSTIYKWLRYLASSERIANEASSRGAIATVCNWDEYQGILDFDESQDERKANAERTLSERQATLIGEGKKERINTKGKKFGIRTEYTQEFESIWKLYGREGDKAEAFRAFQESGLTPEEKTHLLEAIPSYLAECRHTERKLKHFSTFLRTDWKVYPKATQASETTKDDQAGFEHIRRLNEQALARAQKGGAA